jgi:hypothetical protein
VLAVLVDTRAIKHKEERQMNNGNIYRVERASNQGTYIEWWPVKEWSAPYLDVLQYLADKERKYPAARFRIVMVG